MSTKAKDTDVNVPGIQQIYVFKSLVDSKTNLKNIIIVLKAICRVITNCCPHEKPINRFLSSHLSIAFINLNLLLVFIRDSFLT